MLELMAEQPVTGPDNSAANRRRVAPVANRTPRVYRSLGFSPARRVVPHRMKTQRLAERSGAKLPAGVPCPARHICTYFILGSSQGNHSKTDEAFGCELPAGVPCPARHILPFYLRQTTGRNASAVNSRSAGGANNNVHFPRGAFVVICTAHLAGLKPEDW